MRTRASQTAASPPRLTRIVRGLLAAGLLAAACSDVETTAPAVAPADTTRPSAALATAAAADSAEAADSALGETTAASVDGTLNNGQEHTGQIVAVGETDTRTFTATQGNTLIVAMGETAGTANFNPRIRLSAPNGTVIAQNWDYHAAQVQVTAPATGTYTVLLDDQGADGTGSYRVTLVRAPGPAVVVSSGDQGGVLSNGGTHAGSIPVGDVDAWTFNADQGDALIVALGEVAGSASFNPWVRLIAPSGAVIGQNWDYRAAQVQVNAPATGTYTVVVGTYGPGSAETGDYRLTVIEAPGSPIVSSGDQGGAVANGATYAGVITTGDVDAWRFTATQGNTIVVGVGEVSGSTTFNPWVRLIGPNGAFVAQNWDYSAAQVQITAPTTGTYTVVVGTYGPGSGETGEYRLTAITAPGAVTTSTGDQGGPATNGATHVGSIPVGDVDAWQFTATQGNTLVVGMGEITGSATFNPWVRLIAPNGAVVAQNWDYSAAQVQVSAPATGTYTVVVGTYGPGSGETGDYRLTVIEAPDAVTTSSDDQGGAATNGAVHTGAIAVGDVDVWTLDADQGDALVVGMGEIAGSATFNPWVRLVAPNGAVVAQHWDYRAAHVQVAAPATGTYTVIVGTYGPGSGESGDYRLTVVAAPGTLTVSSGDQGGVASNGAIYTGSILVGDVDAWTFDADQGDFLAVGLGEITGSADFNPWLRLIAPNGMVIAQNWDYGAAHVQATAPATGTYTVIVGSYGPGSGGTGDYRLNVVEVPGTPVISSGDQGGAISSGTNYTGNIVVGDLDSWRFTTTLGRRITLTITELSGTTDFAPWIRLVGPTGVVVGSRWDAASAQIVVTAPASGTYRVIVGTYGPGSAATGSYRLRLSLTTPTGEPVDAEPDRDGAP